MLLFFGIFAMVNTLDELMYNIWGPPDNIVCQSHEWKAKRAILCPRNNSVNKINALLLDGINSQEIEFLNVI